ncbi:hypothetical protein Ahy_B03g063306 isoform B [Arachis hypogaea]|uniref:Uncharacterized protein n=1 Tax=Arachis hypogaea TaxID=3818 RepID=A0A444ZWY1_ARAHY|nr:hypothetical protein Ahy_B03g063306 isoform B [Arachis hypogaea]
MISVATDFYIDPGTTPTTLLSDCSPHCSPCSLPFHLRSLATATEVHVHLLYMATKKENE